MAPKSLFILLALLSLLAGCMAPIPGQDSAYANTEPYSGPVLDVPLMTSMPRFDRTIGTTEWSGTATIAGAFIIADGGKADGTYNFTAQIGHSEEWLYLMFFLPDIGPNPYTREDGENSVWLPDAVTIFFTPDLQGPLTPASDEKHFTNARQHGSTTDDGYWDGEEWVVQSARCGEYGGKWDSEREHPVSGTWGRGGYHNDTIFWEIAIPRQPCQPDHDMDFTDATDFRMAFVFQRTKQWWEDGPSPDARGLFNSPHDSFPGDGYTPNGHYDPEGWLRLRLAS